MKINKITNNNFKANYFTMEKKGKNLSLSAISTDNEENLGKEPVIQYEWDGKKHEFPMIYDGKYYTTQVKVNPNKYRIFYKDTGKYERNGEEQVINPLNLIKTATKEDRIYNNLPLEQAIAKGETNGKVFVNTFDIPQDVPAILILDEIKKDSDIISPDMPLNVKSIITSSVTMNTLDHISNQTRNEYNVFCVVYDDDKFNDLKNYAGKYLSLDNENGILKYKEIEAKELTKEEINSISPAKITPPKLEHVEKLLIPEELTPKNCGNKGYRLSLMQKLIKEGKLKDISVPKYFVIPEDYLNKAKEYIGEIKPDDYNDKLYDGIYAQEIDKKIEELGMDNGNKIIRSNFNTEDLRDFSSAGIYHSKYNASVSVLDTIFDLDENLLKKSLESKLAQYVHKKYDIKDEQIQPSFIVQDYIPNKYPFTMYSDDGDNNIIIEILFNDSYKNFANALIKYNKKTKEFNIEEAKTQEATYLIDEKGKITEVHREENPIRKDFEIITPLLRIMTTGAIALEKFFKYPQDIEGGITKDGKVWFWQTRDIVAKAVKKI